MDQRTGTKRSVWMIRTMLGLLQLLWLPISQGHPSSITSSGLNTHVSHVAGQPNYDITGGTRPGNGTNLFHSFGDFSVGANHIANFRNDSGLATANILSRVTGGNPSNIFGTIQTMGFGQANLFLMNPVGIVFGPHASLNVGGSVTVTTANHLKLVDGVRFKAFPNPLGDRLLSASPVAAFGFFGSDPGAITIQGSQLSVPDGKSLTLVGGDIRMIGGALTASSGQINLVSLGGRGVARVAPEGIAISGRTPRGHIEIQGTQPDNVARLDTSGNGGGAVIIRAGQLLLARTEVTTGAKGADQTGGSIVLEATKSATLDSVVLRSGFSEAPTNLNGGPVSLTAHSVRASNLTIDTSAFGSGGNVSIRATGDVTLQNGSRIGAGVSPLDAGDSGDITVQAAKLTLAESRISTRTEGWHARVGNILIDVGRLTVQGGSIETHGIEPDVHGGDIRVTARDAIVIDHGAIGTGNWGTTEGGSITLSTPHLTLDHSGSITAGGLDAPTGDISVNVRTLNMFNGGRIWSLSFGAPGDINIVASRSISMAGGDAPGEFPTIIASESGAGIGGGRVHIVTTTMSLDDRAAVLTQGGNGSILLDVDRLAVLRGAEIQRGQSGSRADGTLIINAAKSITLDHGSIRSGPHQGTNVRLHAGKSIEISNGSLVSAYEGDKAGHITIQAGKSVVIRDSTVSVQAQQGHGGTINVDAKKVMLTNSQLTTSVSGGPQSVGGQISVDAKHLMLRNSQILSTATEGQGGTITIRTHILHRDARSVIDASSLSGTDGTVTIEPLP